MNTSVVVGRFYLSRCCLFSACAFMWIHGGLWLHSLSPISSQKQNGRGCFFLWIRALTGTNFSRPNELSTSDAAAPRRTSPTASRNYGNLLLWPGPFKVLPTQDRTLFVSEKSTFCSPHTRTSTAAIVCACGMESAGANCAKSGVRTLGVAREFCWRIPIVGVGIFGGTLLSRCQAQLFMF